MSKLNGFIATILVVLVFASLMVTGSAVKERSYKRPDPLRGFKLYNGGYNLTDKRYWASAAFTGVHGYAIAAVWLLCGLVFGSFLACKNLLLRHNSNSQLNGLLSRCYLVLFLLIVTLTILAVVATSLVLASSQSSLHRTRKLKEAIVKIGQATHRTIHQLIISMTKIQQMLNPYDHETSVQMYNFTHLLANESKTIRDFVKTSAHAIDTAILTSHIIHVVVVSTNLVFLLASLVVILLHWHPGFITIIVVCWILTTMCWALAGFDFFLHTFWEDTCIELKELDQHPQNSSLGSMIRCMDPSHSDSLLAEAGNAIHNFVSALNTKVTELHAALASQSQNVSGLGSEKICDPFTGPPDYTYMPENCPSDSIPIGDLPDIISNLTCHQGDSPEACKSQGRVIPEAYSEMASAYCRSIQEMLNIFPDLRNLTKCVVVKTTLSDIVSHHCLPLRNSIRFLWLSMLCLSVLMVVLVLSWVGRTCEEKGRSFSRWSIFPNP